MSVPPSAPPLVEPTDARFNPPPGWHVPPGFDPRRGHLPDPTWPPAPDGWEMWTTPPAPGRVAGFVASVGPTKLILGGLLALLAVFFVLGQVFDDEATADGVGSCWSGGEASVYPVGCGSDEAAFRVSSVVDSPDACTGPAGYLEDGTRFLCLEPVR